jgi:hypothetical protein
MKHAKKNTGFSLVEVALAMLVASVGILAVMGLFASSLDTNALATADTQGALFGDYVLNSVRTIASNTNMSWSAIAPGLQIPVPFAAQWSNPQKIKAVSGPVSIQQQNQPIYFVSQGSGISSFGFVCSLQVWPLGSNMKAVQFLVCPVRGTNGIPDLNSLSSFYTEIYRGDSP